MHLQCPSQKESHASCKVLTYVFRLHSGIGFFLFKKTTVFFA